MYNKNYNKQDYIKQQQDSKNKLKDLYESFLTKKKLSDVITIICNGKEIYNHYSFHNRILAYCQGSDNYIGILNSFINWKKQNIQVLKGMKGLQILVPIFIKKEKTDDNNDSIIERIRFFKIGNVFDISQTSEFDNYKKQQLEKDQKVYNNHTIDYSNTIMFVKNNCNCDIQEDIQQQECKGYYSKTLNQIVLHEKTGHTLLHEFSHHLCIDKLKLLPFSNNILSRKDSNYAKHEILAEIATYIIMNKLDSNVKYNFNYSNLWSNNLTSEFDIKEFEGYYKTLNLSIDSLTY